MGKIYKQYLAGDRVFCCKVCASHLALDEIVSKGFQGKHGRAFLFSRVVNVSTGPLEERMLITGLHIVCDIHCIVCQTTVGWKYEEAYEENQKYKVGKFIVERAMMSKSNNWTERG